VKDKIKRKQRK